MINQCGICEREPFEDTMSSEMAWSSGRLLVCGNEHYDVILNPPTVEKVSVPIKLSKMNP